jgi:hypothetical protein
MMTPTSVSDDLSSLIGARKVALVIDTCSIVDILRIPQRWDDNSASGIREIEAAFQLVRDSTAPSGNTKIILPPPVSTELSDNRPEGLKELRKAIRIASAKISIFSKIHELAGIASSLSAPAGELTAVEDALEKLVDDLVLHSISLSESAEAVTAAYARVVKGVAPARKGSNQQMKDCAIVEHLLAVAPRLKAVGCEKIIFLSANKKDFCDESNNLKEPLKTEFDCAGIEYVMLWQVAKVLTLATP